MGERHRGVKVDDERGTQGTQAVARAVAVLDAIATGCSDQGSIAKAIGTTRSTTSRLLNFLQRSGFVRSMDGRGYVLGARLIELGNIALSQLPLSAVARPRIEKLASLTGDTVHLSVRDGDQIMYIGKISASRGLEMRSGVGVRKPMAITGTGKVHMFDLSEKEWMRLYSVAHSTAISEPVMPPGFLPWPEFVSSMRDFVSKGYAFEMEENEASICCIAAPIRNARGDIVAGVSVAGIKPYMPYERMLDLVPLVVQCAHEISHELGYVSGQQ